MDTGETGPEFSRALLILFRISNLETCRTPESGFLFRWSEISLGRQPGEEGKPVRAYIGLTKVKLPDKVLALGLTEC